MDEEPERTKRWEGGYERTWEILKEDESGSLKATIEDILFKAKRKRVFEHHGQVRLGMMRHLYVVVDGSRTMEDQDLKPNRLTCTLKLLEYFVEEYFDQNPISQIGIIVTKSKRAEKLTELSGNPRKHITSLKKAVDMTCHGEPSLYNSLSMAMQTLKHMPGHTSREVLIIFSSLTTCDPSNIYDLIKTLKAAKIRVSIIGLSAEVRVCTVLARETGGTYHVILDESHYKELLTHHVSPPPASSSSECSLIRMGFPQHTIASLSDQDAKPSFSMAHLDSSTEPGLTLGGYFCPQCRAKYCELPVECKICGLTLVSAPHLARSYHHLFPLDPFQEIPLEENKGERFCYGCQGELKDQHVYVCSACQNVFCVDCDVFVHDSLHCCPGCIHKIPTPSVASFVTGYEEILESFSKTSTEPSSTGQQSSTGRDSQSTPRHPFNSQLHPEHQEELLQRAVTRSRQPALLSLLRRWPPPRGLSQDRISQFDYDLLPELSVLLGIDAVQFVKEMEEEEEKDREGMERGFRPQMRSEAKRLQTFVTYHPYSSWTPQEMAAAGFYFTGTKNRVQCFCCGLILCGSRLRRRPLDNHRELGPDCEFLSGKDVGNIAKYDVRVKSPGGELNAHQVRGQDEEARLGSFRLWPFYVQGISPRALSAAGFVFTGKRDIVQCFSCGGCLGNWEEGDDPWKEHAKWFPKCEFLQSKKTSEEIIQYIQSYEGFVDVTGEHFLKSWVQRELPMPSAYGNDSVFANEDLRRDSFKNWPHKSPVGAAALARAGLFYTGIEDVIQCFFCGGCLKNWKEGDDPLEDHTKYFPNCQFLQTLKSSAQVAPDLEGHGELPELTESTKGSSPKESVEVNSTGPERAQGEAQWLQEAKSLSEQLRAAYTDATFRRMTLLEVSSSLATDPLLGCDLSIVTKHVSSPTQEPVALHVALAALNSVMCVEGEAGSGKTVLLKKIAFLWASGCCPLLNRFQLVFYLSLGSTRPDQGLASIICSQLLGTEGSVTEMCLRTIIQQLKNQVLFLLDDYKEMCSLPEVIEKLIQKNHLSQTCVLIAVRTNRARALRRYLDRTLEITAFPFYNTVYILRTFFLHNISRLQRFMVHFGMNEDLQGIQKTPLFVAAVCADWFRRPFHQSFDDDAVFRCYMECLSLKHSTSAELLKATVSSCGELALKGFFASCYEFDGSELTEAGVDEDEELTMSLMSRFSAQRLRPVYRFLNPAFQEFLAGMRLIELLDSDRQEDQDLGLFYLRHIDSSIMAVSPYANFLNYISSHTSTKAGPKIVSHLLQLMSNEASLEIISEDDDYAKRHPRMSEKMQIFRSLWQVSPQAYFSLVSEHFLSLALKIAYQSDTVAACSPFVLEFLRGRTLTWKVLQLQYFFDHPESLLLLRSIQVLIQGVKGEPRPDFSVMAACLDKSQAPTIDQDYASVFEPMEDWEQELAEKEESLKNFLKIRRQAPPDLGAGYWKLSPKQPKIPLLQVHVTRADAVDQDTLRALSAAFSASQHIELHLGYSRGFIESIRPALELCKASVTKCSIGNAELSPEEQELLLTLPSLESLHVEGTPQLQDQIFPNLDKFLHLKELSVNLQGKLNVFSVLPEDSPSFHQMEKLLVRVSAECDPSKLVKMIQNSPNLHVFHLKCDFFLDFESLTTALASCKKLKEIVFSGPFFKAIPFVTILPNFISLKILNLELQQFPDQEISKKFAYTLGSLHGLEELILPTGEAIHQVAKLIVQQCQQLPCLRILRFFQILNDDSVMEIAKVATNGGLQKLETLNLSINHKITEEGYRNFFQALDNLPNLQELNMSRHFTECIKAQAPTVKALSQCVPRLPRLTRLHLLGWLLDTEDITLLSVTKERHPQSKHLTILWKWRLPFSPIIQK